MKFLKELAVSLNALWLSARGAAAFVPYFHTDAPFAPSNVNHRKPSNPISLKSSIGDEEDEEIEPGKMRVSEIKAELEMRGVDFSDCFDKESLATKLAMARATGKADPTIVDKFNRQNIEANFSGEKVEVSDENLKDVVGSDGNLPGGMPPEMLKKMMADPELMTLLQSTKMQDAMKLMMTGGQDALEKALKEDPEVYEVIQKLNQVMAKLQ